MADFLDAVQSDAGLTEPQPVTIVNKGAAVNMDPRPAAATFTSIARQTASATLLAANPARRGARIVNTDAMALNIDLSGGVASAARFAVQLASNGEFQVPFGYTGQVTGAWVGTGVGAALVTDFTD